jgi:hypothetical protein
MVLADVHCIFGAHNTDGANMNHYDMVTVFYSLQQSVREVGARKSAFNASFYTNFELYK